jgi:hypothetical protein
MSAHRQQWGRATHNEHSAIREILCSHILQYSIYAPPPPLSNSTRETDMGLGNIIQTWTFFFDEGWNFLVTMEELGDHG